MIDKHSVPLELDFFLNQETSPIVDTEPASLEALASFVLGQEGARGRWELVASLVSDDRLRQLHRDYMGIDAPTDVMTFPLDDPEGKTVGGDIVVSADHAVSRGVEWGNRPEEEIRFLLVHGLLHLTGWSDETDDDRKAMLRRQQELIDLFNQG